MQIRIEASDLPGSSCGPGLDVPTGYRNIHVGVQHRKKGEGLLHPVPGDAPSATWTIECSTVVTPTGIDVKGPYVQGPPGGRFIYLSWVAVEGDRFTRFRRAKLWLEAVPPDVLLRSRDTGGLVGRLGLTDQKGNPVCASVRPPLIEWVAAAAT